MSVTAEDVAAAWNSVDDQWFSRLNKTTQSLRDGRVWEVVHAWGDVISDDTQKVVTRFSSMEEADALALKLEEQARGTAVLRMIEEAK